MSASRPSIESMPLAASISARSSGEWTRYGNLGLGLRRLLIRRFVHQVGGQVTGQLQLQDPAVAVRVGVDELGLGRQLLVDRAHAAGDRGIEITRGLH